MTIRAALSNFGSAAWELLRKIWGFLNRDLSGEGPFWLDKDISRRLAAEYNSKPCSICKETSDDSRISRAPCADCGAAICNGCTVSYMRGNGLGSVSDLQSFLVHRITEDGASEEVVLKNVMCPTCSPYRDR